MDIKEKLEKGYIHTRAIVEVLGKPKEHVEKTIKSYIENIKKIKQVELLNEDIAEPKEQKNKIWSTFAELEILFKNIATLTNFCFNFMPSSIEILAPEQIKLQNREIAAIINDLQARLHTLHATAETLKNQNIVYKKSTQNILRNFVILLLFTSGKTLLQLSKLTGLSEKNIEIFLENLIKQEQIKKEGDKYILIK